MDSGTAQAGWLNALIGLTQAAQLLLLRVLDALGFTGHAHGQAAWPWAVRLSGDNLLIDLGQARRLGLSVIAIGVALLLLLLGLARREHRVGLLALGVLLIAIAPWPAANVVLVPAYPTSFTPSPTGFSAASIERGRVLYAAQCIACHGDDGRGHGPLAASQPVWPPNLAGPLLWRRADGDVLWHVLHGMQDRHGAPTMPAFQRTLNESDAWALIDFMKAQGAGQSLREAGLWTQPIAPPDVRVQCDGKPSRRLGSWRGQRIRIVALADDEAPRLEDGRLVTLYLSRRSTTPDVDCAITDPAAWAAFSLIAATDALEGTQLLVDRDGWLRARSLPGQGAWRDDDLLCRSEPGPATTEPLQDGLGALIARMDAQPVRYIKGGYVH